MEGVDMSPEFWKGRKVLVTGHTGFKGAWLCEMLRLRGAEVFGLALRPAPDSLAALLPVDDGAIGDVTDFRHVEAAVRCEPEIVLHLAAQPIVIESYAEPCATFNVNVMGTANVLQACRSCKSVKAIVVVTSDKCYGSQGRLPFMETDRLEAADPYSASKTCAELVAASFYKSFFKDMGVGLATARAGNVIGAGDRGRHRLLPDFFRAAANWGRFELRNPGHVRPWQHVLDALNGYVMLAERLFAAPRSFSEAWNFGPLDSGACWTAAAVIEFAASLWPASVERSCAAEPSALESPELRLNAAKAAARLGWRPKMDTRAAIANVVEYEVQLLFSGAGAQLTMRKALREFMEMEGS